MSDTILGGDVTVTYLDENRQKMLTWTGAATGTATVNALYSALQDLFDESLQMDNETPMSAETPVEYTIGNIDAGSIDPWYMTYEFAQHLTGGAVKTAGWTRVTSSATGIVVAPVTSNTLNGTDIGTTVTQSVGGDSGTLLEIIEAGATDYLVIRPDSNAAANDFDSVSGNIENAGMTRQGAQGAVAETGEQIWANMFNVTPVDADTHIYMYQGQVDDATRARIADITTAGQDWWEEGAFDRLIFTHDFKTATFPQIDAGNITVFSRKGNTLYDNFEITTSATSGGRNPVPLSASADLNQLTGYQSITQTASALNWTVGDEVEGDTSGARAIITQIDNPGATQTLHYYLIGDPQTTFQTAAENITNNDDDGTGTKDGNVPAAQGPALNTWFTSNVIPTAVHAFTTFDVDDAGGAEGYGITLDGNANPVTEIYEWTKYVTRNGETGTTPTDGIEGEQYVGPTVYLEWSGAVSGTITEGNDVLQTTSGATGIIVSSDETLKQMLLRDVRGTFDTSNVVTDVQASGTVTPDVAATAFGPVKSAPFGSLAGGRFFGARGVLLIDVIAADENNYQLIDSQGNPRTRPIQVTITVSNLVGAAETEIDSDRIAAFRLTAAGGVIEKTEFSAAGGEAIGAATLVVDGAIPADVPGKATGGVLRIRDFSNANKDYRIRFSSWVTSTFTLANIVVTAEALTDENQIVDTGVFGGAKRGDLVLNTTRGDAISYITSVDDANTIQISPPITSQVSGDAIEINAIPVIIATEDDVFVPFIDEHATGSEATSSFVFVGTIDYRVVVRNQANATKIKPFTTDDQMSSATNRAVATIRNPDTIAS